MLLRLSGCRRPRRDVVALANEGEAVGNRQELAAALDALHAEAVLEESADGRYKGRPAGQEHLVDPVRRRRGFGQDFVECPFYSGKVGRNPGFEFITTNGPAGALS